MLSLSFFSHSDSTKANKTPSSPPDGTPITSPEIKAVNHEPEPSTLEAPGGGIPKSPSQVVRAAVVFSLGMYTFLLHFPYFCYSGQFDFICSSITFFQFRFFNSFRQTVLFLFLSKAAIS